MSAARSLSRDALRGLIAHKDYWNSSDPDFEARQRKVREGFAALYPASGDYADAPVPAWDRLDDRDEVITAMQRRFAAAFEEYDELTNRYVPRVPVYDANGRMLRDYVPIPPEIEERKRMLNEEIERLREAARALGAPLGIDRELKN